MLYFSKEKNDFPEVPSSKYPQMDEDNLNRWSCMGKKMWLTICASCRISSILQFDCQIQNPIQSRKPTQENWDCSSGCQAMSWTIFCNKHDTSFLSASFGARWKICTLKWQNGMCGAHVNFILAFFGYYKLFGFVLKFSHSNKFPETLNFSHTIPHPFLSPCAEFSMAFSISYV